MSQPRSVYDFVVRDLHGHSIDLINYAGQVSVVVNIASLCSCASQLQELQVMFDDLSHRGFQVLAFPCNQFGFQEPGTNRELDAYYRNALSLTFPIFAKIDVNGPSALELWNFLRDAAPEPSGGKKIPWNYTKFLVSRQGRVLGRFSSVTSPGDLRKEIEAAIGATGLPPLSLQKTAQCPSNLGR